MYDSYVLLIFCFLYLWFLGSSGVLDIDSHVMGSSRCGKSIDVRKEGGLEEN
jgi:hypothetical protein